MAQSKYTFKSSAEIELNDVVYPGPPFELKNLNYKFIITPKSTYWRFGMRFSKSSFVEFYPDSRYKNKNQFDLDIAVGETIEGTKKWHLQNRIQLEKYDLGINEILKRYDNYSDDSEVSIGLSFDEEREELNISFRSHDLKDLDKIILLSGYKYFQIYAWADWKSFEIDCLISIASMDRDEISSSGTGNQAPFFDVGKLTFRLGDMFDPELLSKTNIILFPASSNGSATETIIDAASRIGIPSPPPPNVVGSVLTYETQMSYGVNFAGWVYSVNNVETSSDAGPSSSLTILEKICSKIADFTNSDTDHNFNIPLFGAGAGQLDPVEVAETYLKLFNNSSRHFKVFVSIPNREYFDKIRKKVTSIPLSKTLPEIKTRLHSDSYNLDEEDILRYDIIAENIYAILVDKETSPPLNIGILAPWGRGKTSLMKRLKSKFDKSRSDILSKQDFEFKKNGNVIAQTNRENSDSLKIGDIPSLKVIRNWFKTDKMGIFFNIPYLTVWFNPWNYQSTEMIWGGLAYAVIEQSVSQIPSGPTRELFRLQLRLSRIDKEKVRKDIQNFGILIVSLLTLAVIFLLASVILFLLNPNNWWFVSGTTSLALGFWSGIQYFGKNGSIIIERLNKYDKQLEYLNKLGPFHEVESDLKKVFEYLVAADKPMVIFVDDLDRCSPAKVVEVVEAINVFINSDAYKDKCYFILGMDAEMVAAALDSSYEKMKGRMGGREKDQGSVGWYFLDKFIQLPFFIPVMNESKKNNYLGSLLRDGIDNQLIKVAPDGEKVKEVFKQVMSSTVNSDSYHLIRDKSLSIEEEKELDKMILQNQVVALKQNDEIIKNVGLYAPYISSDPRSLKRFANLLRFYSGYQFLRMKKGEPYADIGTLAKWLAIMLRFPQIVRWIQWDSDYSIAVTLSSEEKAIILDNLIIEFHKDHLKDDGDHFNYWLKIIVPTKISISAANETIEKFQTLPWLKSRNFYDIIMNKYTSEPIFKGALDCHVW